MKNMPLLFAGMLLICLAAILFVWATYSFVDAVAQHACPDVIPISISL